MTPFTVALFGHRVVDDLSTLEERLAPIVSELLSAKSHVLFLIGRNGEFDEYAASVIKRIKRQLAEERGELVLVLPYTVAGIEYYESYYDAILIPEELHGVHPKSAITKANRWMVDHARLVIGFVQARGGGADAALKYAQRRGIRTINLGE